ncbi:membrane protein [Hymenobacter coalescens]
MSANKLTVLALLSLLGASSAASGQGLGNSPYSRLGLGDFTPNTGGIRQQGMGGVGLAAPNAVQINDLNPALVYYTNRTTYEVAFTGQLKDLRSSSASQRTGGGTLGYLAFGVPISRRWAVSVALRPLSSVDYKSQQVSPVPGAGQSALVRNEFTGSGGLSEVALSQGVRVAKGLTVGLTSAYVFGSIDRSTSALVNPYPDSLLDTEVLRQVVRTDHVQYNDFAFRAGLHYRYDLSKKLVLNVAGVYGFQTKLSGTRTQQEDEQNINGSSLLAAPVEVSSVSGYTVLPAAWQAGVSLDNNKNWSLSADVARQQWSKYRDFGLTSVTPLADTWRVGLGGELAPDPGSVSSYFKRVTYRVGLSMAQLPYRPGGQALYDRAVSWGFSLPFPTSSSLDATTLNLAFSYGQRGNNDVVTLEGNRRQANIQENYLKVQVGVSLNNRWFLKRRIE